MKSLSFKKSHKLSLGVELELQLIDPMNYDLISRAKDLMRNIQTNPLKKRIKPEITQSMIEVNSSIHHTPQKLYKELLEIKNFLLAEGKKIGILIASGGTHPFQKWALRKIFPTQRFKHKSRQFRYLSKCSTVFGEHIHIGCKNAAEAIYLTHILSRYVPQLIALTASSPFSQNVDTGFDSSRANVFSAYPLSGPMPYFTTWKEFSNYFAKFKKLKIIETMKDVYWDIRPKPEFGTIEIRICDAPLTIKKTVTIAAYVQTLAHYLLRKRPHKLSRDLFFLYGYNRFQADRYGFDGEVIDPFTLKSCTIQEDILATVKLLEKDAEALNTVAFLNEIKVAAIKKENDAKILRQCFKKTRSLPKVVQHQCQLWANSN